MSFLRTLTTRTKTLKPLFQSQRQARGLQTLTLPDLAYDYGSLEPAISGEIMQIHHQKHHQTYVTNYNKAIEQLDVAIANGDASSAVKLHTAVNFNGGGHVNHSIFWKNLAPIKEGGGQPPHGSLSWTIDNSFSSLEKLIAKMNAEGAAVQGSGWVWLALDKDFKRLVVETTANQDPLVTKGPNLVPLIGIDVWEHAYYLQVNPTNEQMFSDGGADGAIHRAAGPELRTACYEVPEVRPGIRCPTGEARITRGFKLPVSHVIHTVGPDYDDINNASALLSDAYRNSLLVARENNINYVSFPAISCGIFGYPLDEAAIVAISTIKEHCIDIKEVHFVLFADDIYDLWVKKAKELLPNLHQQTCGLHTLTLPDLPYDYGSLEPAISGEIMQIHHQKHHQAYVTNYNKAIKQLHTAIANGDASSAVKLQSVITFNGGGHVNHSIFWKNLAPIKEGGGQPPHGSLRWAIDNSFGSLEKLIAKMNAEGAAVQGSGWVWLALDKEFKRLVVETTSNQDPLVTKGPNLVPLIGIDVWEHAYYLQYKNVRPDYLKNIWKVINWKYASDLYEMECP